MINRSQLMKNAWRTYKYSNRGRSFGEVLKTTWMLAKVQSGIDRMNAKHEARVAELNRTAAERDAKRQREQAITSAKARAEYERELAFCKREGITWDRYNEMIMR